MLVTSYFGVKKLIIDVRELSFKYKGVKDKYALKNINFSVSKGEFVVITGASGAGKSTLLQCLNGLIPHYQKGLYSGEVIILNKNIREHRVGENVKEVGLVFQDFEAQLFSTNAALEILFGPENLNFSDEEMDKIIMEIFPAVCLSGLEDRAPSSLSGGQKQRLAIGSILAIDPKIVCMDEPTTDLDPGGKIGIVNIIKDLQSKNDKTVILVEHELEEIITSDRIIVMNKGQIVLNDNSANVLKEVEVLEANGVFPLQVPLYFHKLGLAKEMLPLLPEEGVRLFKRLPINLDSNQYNKLIENDKERINTYKNVVLETIDLNYKYPDGSYALQGIDIQIRENEFVAIVGHNGSGKTTLIKHLTGLIDTNHGNILIRGKSVKELTVFEIGQKIGLVFQNPDHQIFSETVYEEVAFSLKLRGLSENAINERVKEALKVVNLSGYEDEDPFFLTKGERQRLAIASVIAAESKIIILDEPTTGLDYHEQRQVMDLIKKLNKSGHTIIIITHVMWVVAEYAHRTLVMKDGEVALDGITREILGKENLLKELSIRPPHITEFSKLLGITLLSVDEMLDCTNHGGVHSRKEEKCATLPESQYSF